jgi:hypothetical protein
MVKYKSISLDRYVYSLLHQIGNHMRGPDRFGLKPYSIPKIITILAESYHINNIVIPKQWEKEMKNEI